VLVDENAVERQIQRQAEAASQDARRGAKPFRPAAQA
jgi:hypothetical protein